MLFTSTSLKAMQFVSLVMLSNAALPPWVQEQHEKGAIRNSPHMKEIIGTDPKFGITKIEVVPRVSEIAGRDGYTYLNEYKVSCNTHGVDRWMTQQGYISRDFTVYSVSSKKSLVMPGPINFGLMFEDDYVEDPAAGQSGYVNASTRHALPPQHQRDAEIQRIRNSPHLKQLEGKNGRIIDIQSQNQAGGPYVVYISNPPCDPSSSVCPNSAQVHVEIVGYESDMDGPQIRHGFGLTFQDGTVEGPEEAEEEQCDGPPLPQLPTFQFDDSRKTNIDLINEDPEFRQRFNGEKVTRVLASHTPRFWAGLGRPGTTYIVQTESHAARVGIFYPQNYINARHVNVDEDLSRLSKAQLDKKVQQLQNTPF